MGSHDGVPHDEDLRRHRRNVHRRRRRRRAGPAAHRQGADEPRARVRGDRARGSLRWRPTLGLTVEELLARTEVFTYGTTRSTNAIVEGTTARTAFFTTEGLPDVLLLKEGGKLDPFKQIPYPPPYVPRFLTFEIRERMDSEGEPFIPLDEESVLRAIEQGRSAWRRGRRGLSHLVDRQPRPRATASAEIARRALAGRAVHALASAQSDHPGVPTRFVDCHRRLAQATHAGVSRDDGARSARRGLRRASLRLDLVRRRLATATRSSSGRSTRSAPGPSMAPVAAVTYAREELLGRGPRADRLRHGRNDVRRRSRLGRRDQLHGRDVARRALDRAHHRHPLGRREVDRRRRRLDRLDRSGRAPASRAAERGRRPRVRRATAAAAPSRPSPTPPSCSAGSTRDYFLGGRLQLDADAARAAIERRRSRPARDERRGGGLRGSHDRDREHRRRDPRDHDRPGHRPARGGDRRGRGSLGAEHRAHRARARLALRCSCPRRQGRSRPAERSTRTSSPSSRGACTRRRGHSTAPRSTQRSPRSRRPRTRSSRDLADIGAERDAQGLLGRGPLPRPGVGARGADPEPAARARTTCARSRRRSTRRTSASSPSASRASTSSACSGRCAPPRFSRSPGVRARELPRRPRRSRLATPGLLPGDGARPGPTL